MKNSVLSLFLLGAFVVGSVVIAEPSSNPTAKHAGSVQSGAVQNSAANSDAVQPAQVAPGAVHPKQEQEPVIEGTMITRLNAKGEPERWVLATIQNKQVWIKITRVAADEAGHTKKELEIITELENTLHVKLKPDARVRQLAMENSRRQAQIGISGNYAGANVSGVSFYGAENAKQALDTILQMPSTREALLQGMRSGRIGVAWPDSKDASLNRSLTIYFWPSGGF